MRAALFIATVPILAALVAAGQEASPKACTLAAFLQARAAIREGTATFTQERHIHYLKEPVFSVGLLRYAAPNRLEMKVESPQPEAFVYEDGTLTIDADSQDSRQISVDAHLVLSAMFTGLIGTLSGDDAMLATVFEVTYQVDECRWRMSLVPKAPRTRDKVAVISLSGTDQRIEAAEILEANGDRSLLRIGELE